MGVRDHKIQLAARAISIVGHPAVTVPMAILLTTARPLPSWTALSPLVVALALAGVLMFWSQRQVRKGKWLHVDASNAAERKELNWVMLTVLGTASLLAAGVHAMTLSVGLASGALVIVLAIIAGGHFKLSQHVAFATLSVFIASYAGSSTALAFGGMTALIAWSRLRLHRHSAIEVFGGLCAGTLAGIFLVINLTHLIKISAIT